MAYSFGADANAIVQDQQGNIITGSISYTLWTDQSGGTQVTNLLDSTGTPWPGGVVTPDSRGRLIFSDPTDTYLLLWAENASNPSDPRIAIQSRDVGPALQALIATGATAIPLAQKGAAGGVATLDGSGLLTLAEIPPDVMTDADKNLPLGVAGLDASSKLATGVLPDVDAAPYLRQRQGTWDLERERVVRGLSATDYSLTFAAILADAGYQDGDTIVVRKGTYPLLTKVVINKSVNIEGKGGVNSVFTTAVTNMRMFEVTASNVIFDRLGMTGPGSATYNSASFAIYAVGVSALSPIENLTVRRCRISQIASNAIQTEFVNDVLVEKCTITNVVRAGWMCLSGDKVRFNQNIFDTATNGTGNPSSNGYAVAFSRNTTVDLATQPRTTNFEAKGNWVKNIPHWEGIDTHGGMFGVIEGNFLYNCDQPIAVVSSAGAVISSEFAPHYVSVRDNHMDSTVTDGSRKPGIVIDGAGTGAAGSFAELSVGCTVSGNTVIGHGRENTSISAGMTLTYIMGLKVSDNIFRECSPSAIAVSSDVWGAEFTGNVFIDYWTLNVSGTMANPGIVFHAANGSATVSGNIVAVSSKSVTPPAIKNTRGIRVGNIANNSIIQYTGNNFNACPTPIQDLGPTTKLIMPYDRTNVYSGEAAASGSPAVTETWTDIAGATVTFATKVFNVKTLVTVVNTSTIGTVQAGTRSQVRLVVDGVAETEVASVSGATLGTGAGAQTYVVTLASPGNHTLKLQAFKNGATIAATIVAGDTKFSYIALDG